MIESDKKKVVLITGVAGFVGGPLAESFLKEGMHEIHGIDLAECMKEEAGLKAYPNFTCHAWPENDSEKIHQLISRIEPDYIFHLAGASNVAQSWKTREITFRANFWTCLQLLESVRRNKLDARILIIGSGEQYGLVPEEKQPIKEHEPYDPRTPYAASKVCQEILGRQYFQTDKLNIVLIRAFNHIGPRQKPTFVAADFARQVAAIELGKCQPVMRVGNLKARRDFTDVRDMIRAYRTAIKRCPPGQPFNISSENTLSIKQILDFYLQNASVPIKVEEDPAKFRPVDIPLISGDASKFRKFTGWQPQYDIKDTLTDILNFWRRREADNKE